MERPPSATDDGRRMSDDLWERIEALLPPRPPHPLGCHNPRVPDRRAMDAILLVLRTGCRWNDLNDAGLCSSSSAHRRCREWAGSGVFDAFRAMDPGEEATRGIVWSRLAPRIARRAHSRGLPGWASRLTPLDASP